jgi:ABC-type nitrate/sulfonate/bicarbonate transport system substrate-binding protein
MQRNHMSVSGKSPGAWRIAHGESTSPIKHLFWITAVLVALATAAGLWSCSKGDYSGKMESITIGTIPWEPSALIYIADERKFFTANGLDVIVKDYDTGLGTTQALLQGDVNIAACAEFITVERIFQNLPICNIATIAKSQNEYIIARIDKGIRTVADLKSKKIGLPRQTIAEFYLGRFLELHRMNLRDITLVDERPSKLADALAGGDVDAVVAWQPHVAQIEKQLANSIVVWGAQSGQLMYLNITGTDTWIRSKSESVNRLLRSLAQAENYLKAHPDDAKAIVQKRLKYNNTYINAVWPEHQFSLSLDHSLIAAMEDEARWMIKNNLTKEKQIPDFMNYIYVGGLKAIKPEAVNIIR